MRVINAPPSFAACMFKFYMLQLDFVHQFKRNITSIIRKTVAFNCNLIKIRPVKPLLFDTLYNF